MRLLLIFPVVQDCTIAMVLTMKGKLHDEFLPLRDGFKDMLGNASQPYLHEVAPSPSHPSAADETLYNIIIIPGIRYNNYNIIINIIIMANVQWVMWRDLFQEHVIVYIVVPNKVTSKRKQQLELLLLWGYSPLHCNLIVR